MALGTGDADLALALGDGEHLAAVRALEVCRGLATLPHLLGRALGTLKVFLAGAGRARGAGRCGPAAQAGDELAQAGDLSRAGDKGVVLLATCIDVFGQAAQHADHDDSDGDPAEPLDAGYRSDHRDDDADKTHYDGEFIGAIATLHKVIHANCLSFDILHAFIPLLVQGGQVRLHQLLGELVDDALYLGELGGLEFLVARFDGRGDAALDVSLEHIGVDAGDERLRGHELRGNIDAVAVLLDHPQDAVDLTTCRFEHAGHRFMVCHHGGSSFLVDLPDAPVSCGEIVLVCRLEALKQELFHRNF